MISLCGDVISVSRSGAAFGLGARKRIPLVVVSKAKRVLRIVALVMIPAGLRCNTVFRSVRERSNFLSDAGNDAGDCVSGSRSVGIARSEISYRAAIFRRKRQLRVCTEVAPRSEDVAVASHTSGYTKIRLALLSCRANSANIIALAHISEYRCNIWTYPTVSHWIFIDGPVSRRAFSVCVDEESMGSGGGGGLMIASILCTVCCWRM